LHYFRCNPSNPDKNCKGLVTTFSNSATRSFTTANGDTYYKLNEANSRFVANGDRRGIFINDVPEETVMKFKDLIVFVNAKVMKDRVNFAAPRICQDTTEKLQTITSSSLALKQEGLVASIQGQGVSHNLDCSVQVDFSLPTKGKLLSLTASDITTTTGTTTTGSITTGTNTSPLLSGENNTKVPDGSTSTITTPIQRNPNVAQFPLNEEKGLTYTSTRGSYSLKFPSGNISYAISMVKENFGQANVSCSSVINVIKYSDKENLEISPAIRIYECEPNTAITAP
jgi:hypothetical protein